MADEKRRVVEAFDFSLDAEDFKARLWRKLEKQMAEKTVQPLDDDDLEWVNAAGMAVRNEEDAHLD